MAINQDILAMVLGILGIKDIRAATNDPQAKINITFKRQGKLVELNLTLQEIIEAIQSSDPASADRPKTEELYKAGG